ncbi:tRNA (adenosine(37)-N6)-dimethylallyltransferase MiaA [Nocardioides sp. CFH 31398]|uniref:tRNA (adenosine(37)-N6)-dimethylallyltransferase MiaA n=1 Tax=Nocardioides sp. CFH 31398 TaxID=2919579 RepID=UPI001F05EA18|nr:tRNA (adenosine(37)-N6)-dimethylallyltransferase MiaA [Nocardioides sp. CFH 31398]MCH1867570.1 tRNA (adenosine(37)-N6)-dimethylallyltransferase MiaA [Nocardioides sp. CFH 31398]
MPHPARPPEPHQEPPPVLAVVGATAAGKSEVALGLAERLGGEVVNTDAMQLYRGMDIGTAKLAPAERRGVRHHLLDVLDVTETASVATFQREARAVVADLRARGVVPVLVGGSALYTRAVVDTLEFPGTDPVVRARLEAELDDVGPAVLHARLAGLDPVAAAGIEPGNGRRTVRALEVVEITGRPFSASMPEPTYVEPATLQLGVEADRAVLDARIAARVDAMYDAGLLAEVERLLAAGLAEGRTASRAIGYREAAAHLAGELTEAEARERTVVATRRFVRRQDAWFRKDPRVVWVRDLDEALVEVVSRHAVLRSRARR